MRGHDRLYHTHWISSWAFSIGMAALIGFAISNLHFGP